MATFPKRQPAKKFWIADILNAEQKTNEQGFKYYTIRGKEAIRVNLVACVVSSYMNEAGNYGMLIINDGSAQMQLKAWNEDAKLLTKIQIGEIALVVGKINTDNRNKEIFIKPEIIKPTSSDWMQLRITELKREYAQAELPAQKETAEEAPQFNEETVTEDEPITGVALAVRERIIQAIEANDSANGAEIASVIKNSGVNYAEAEAAVSELIREGEAFQLKQGFIKLIS